MALTIISSPPAISPAGNSNVWTIDSDQPNFMYLIIQVRSMPTDTLISNLRIYPTPINVARCFVEVGSIMFSYLSYKLLNYVDTIVTTVPGAIEQYKLSVLEIVNVGGVPTPTTPDPQDSVTKAVFKGTLDPITLRGYTYNKYVLNPANTSGGGAVVAPVNFLTTQPGIKFTLPTSDEGLYIMQNGAAYVPPTGPAIPPYGVVLITKKDGSTSVYLIDVGFTATPAYTMWRINLSPSIIAGVSGVPLNTISSYTFHLQAFDLKLTNTQTYVIDETYCNSPLMPMYFINKFGVIDTYTLVHPESSVDVDRANVQRNFYRINSSGAYTNFDNDTFNIVDQIFNTGVTESLTASTRVLRDEDSTWLSNVITSPQTYTKIAPKVFIPLILADNTYANTPNAHLDNVNVKTFKFKLSEGFTPDFKLS